MTGSRFPLAALAGLLLAFVLVGCNTAPRVSAGDEGAPVAPPSAYIIGPGDTLQVFVWRNPDISATVPVRPDGRISTPLVEDMVAVGKTPSQLARDIEGVLEEYIRSPQVNIIVEGFVGTFGEQIRVVGQAGEPRGLPYRDRMTLLDVMIEVGGLTEFAAGNRARVVRQLPDGGTEEIRVRLHDLMNRGDMRHNIAMRPGDVVIIPESLF
ncbi:MAG: polysaccharide export protein [Gammaproteobacteria bacterium]|nr:polysaccharide export protein [Gammaproteobacteria bacterium]